MHNSCRGAVALALSVALMGGVGCSPKAPGIKMDGTATGNVEAESLFREARVQFEKGEIGAADEGFARIIREFPDDPLVRAAIIYRARIALKLDNPQRARTLLAPIKGMGEPTAERALLYDGRALEQLDQNDEAIRVLEPLVDRLTDPEDIRELETALWNAARKAGDLLRAARSIERLTDQLEDAQARKEVLRSFKRALVPISDIEALETLADGLSKKGAVLPIVQGRIAELYLETGNFQKAQEILDRLERIAPDEQISETSTEPPSESVDTGVVGFIAPLSGRARLVGDAAVNGATLAARETGVRLAVRNTESDPETAAQAVTYLVEQEHAAIIVGPLDAAAAQAAAQKAQTLGVPILTLSVREEVTALGDFVFREFAGNRIEPAALLDIAVSRGARRCGVLFPENGYGRVMRALFSAAVKDRGLILAGEASYAKDAVSFKEQAERLAEQDLDVLFIPDQAAKIALIAPALAAAGIWSSGTESEPPPDNVASVQLIIPSVGFSEDLIRRAGRYLNGALFSVFFAPEVHPGSQAFASRYNLEYGMRPSMVSAYGHDAVLIAGHALKSGAARSRDDLRRWLVEEASRIAPDLTTAAPFAGFTENGAPKAGPYILMMEDGRFSLAPVSR